MKDLEYYLVNLTIDQDLDKSSVNIVIKTVFTQLYENITRTFSEHCYKNVFTQHYENISQEQITSQERSKNFVPSFFSQH